MKKYYLLLFLGLFLQQLHTSFGNETKTFLRYYNSTGGSFFYRQPDIVRQAARFSITSPCYLKGLTVLLGGEAATGQATVHIYGHEGGAAAPVLGKELISPFIIFKTIAGPQKITVELPNKIFLDNNQFFVVIDGLSAGTVLLSDHVEKPPACSSVNGGTFTWQALQTDNGRWFYGRYAYYIDANIEYIRQPSTVFERDSLILNNGDIIRRDLSGCNLNCTDINRDGYLDLMIGATVLVNDGMGKFTTMELGYDKVTDRIVGIFIDMDNDGWDDILLVDVPSDSSVPQHKILLNENGRFKEQKLLLPAIKNLTTFSIADINADGFPDLFIGQNTISPDEPLTNYLLLNNKNLSFSDKNILPSVSATMGSTCMGAAFADINNDSYPDLYVTNYSTTAVDEVWINQGSGVMTKMATGAAPGLSSGCFLSDINNDGTIDALIAHRKGAGNEFMPASQLYLNTSRQSDIQLRQAALSQLPSFEERHSGGAIADVNNDGLQDYILLTSCQCRYADLYIQNTNGKFELKTSEYGLEGLAGNQDALWADFNNDGRLDLAIIDKGQLLIYRNKVGSGNNYIQIELQTGGLNKSSAGSQIKVFTKEGVYTQQVISGRGLLMQDPCRLHFGLGKVESVDSILVSWPGVSGHVEKFTNLAINKVHQLKDGSGNVREIGKSDIVVNAHPNPFTNEVSISYSLEHTANITITIYDAQGRIINEVFSGRRQAGNHSVLWNRRDHTGMRVAPGLYMYSYSVDGHQTVNALTIVD